MEAAGDLLARNPHISKILVEIWSVFQLSCAISKIAETDEVFTIPVWKPWRCSSGEHDQWAWWDELGLDLMVLVAFSNLHACVILSGFLSDPALTHSGLRETQCHLCISFIFRWNGCQGPTVPQTWLRFCSVRCYGRPTPVWVIIVPSLSPTCSNTEAWVDGFAAESCIYGHGETPQSRC